MDKAFRDVEKALKLLNKSIEQIKQERPDAFLFITDSSICVIDDPRETLYIPQSRVLYESKTPTNYITGNF